ncbi:uncharacterized protein LOC131045374 [Cryptomeria japonica]|uniref:uncharacterized protein LOC131045374 n=1 Tax=Cryptomeria japonica TaxID=3369 RepID=UPI0027DA294F|nr:uncharacterized protein LOC131045374 [Cryptomeria japonica]
MKRARSRISCIQDCQGNILSEDGDISKEAVKFFKNLLSSENIDVSNSISSLIPSLVSPEDNTMLMSPFSIEEVRGAVFAMNPDKAPKPDGFTPLFFQKCWEFVGQDVLLALEEARRNRSILKEMNTTLIVILPKKDDPKTFTDFRPIALCNTIYKIFSKVIAMRLAKLLPRIISLEQGGFVPQRLTPEGAIVAHEAIGSARESGSWKGIKIQNFDRRISHCLFADDTLLFGCATLKEAQAIDQVIRNYVAFSGQKVNKEKSKIFFLNTQSLLRDKLQKFWGFQLGDLPCTYLGVPFFANKVKVSFWDKKVSGVSKKILAWNHKWLTMAGKIVLIKSVLNAVPTYLMSILKAPKDVIVSLKDTLRSFLWNNNRDGKSRIPLLARDKVCLPKELGGSGIRSLENQNLALGAKLVWKSYDNPASLWARIMFAKYLSNGARESIFRAESLPKGSAIWNFKGKSLLDYVSPDCLAATVNVFAGIHFLLELMPNVRASPVWVPPIQMVPPSSPPLEGPSSWFSIP